MTAIINRTPTGRVVSLHAEIKYLYKKYGEGFFSLTDMKYDWESKINPLMYFPLAEKHDKIGLYDPYLENILSKAGFHLTQSKQYDTQKSKSVSECLNALEALGWAERVNGKAKITNLGIKISKLDYFSEEFSELFRKSVLGYGVFIGFLYNVLRNMEDTRLIKKSLVDIGYPNTKETINFKGVNIPLSIGSQKDTIVRTRSTLFAWAFSSGFLIPDTLQKPSEKTWSDFSLEHLKAKKWNWSKYKVLVSKEFFNKKIYVDRPLNYNWMTKSIKALRERGQEEIRKVSLNAEAIVKNRRFALVYCLGYASQNEKVLNFNKLLDELKKLPSFFVVNKINFEQIMNFEKKICEISGIPFIEKKGKLFPLTTINFSELCKGAPRELIDALNKFVKKVIENE